MTCIERVKRAFDYEPVDRVPFENGTFSDEFLAKWASAKGHAKATRRDLDAYYGADGAEVMADHDPWPSRVRTIEEGPGYAVEVDGFGQTAKRFKDKPFNIPLGHALDDKSELGRCEFDAPGLDSRYEKFERELGELREKYWVRLKVGGPYSRSKWLRGEETFLLDMAEDPGFVTALVERMTDHLIAVGLESARRANLERAVIHIHDDMASVRSTFFSPRMFERFFLAPYRRMCEAFHGAGARVFYGGEGNIGGIFEQLLGAGIDGFQCLEQRAGMDMVELRRRYGRGVLFFGNLCNTVVLPSNDRERIRREVARQMEVAREGRAKRSGKK